MINLLTATKEYLRGLRRTPPTEPNRLFTNSKRCRSMSYNLHQTATCAVYFDNLYLPADIWLFIRSPSLPSFEAPLPGCCARIIGSQSHSRRLGPVYWREGWSRLPSAPGLSQVSVAQPGSPCCSLVFAEWFIPYARRNSIWGLGLDYRHSWMTSLTDRGERTRQVQTI